MPAGVLSARKALISEGANAKIVAFLLLGWREGETLESGVMVVSASG